MNNVTHVPQSVPWLLAKIEQLNEFNTITEQQEVARKAKLELCRELLDELTGETNDK